MMKLLVAGIATLSILAPSALGRPAADADRAAARERRRTPVVEVFERSKDAVVSISSTEIVVLRGRSPFGSVFDDFFEMPAPRTRRQVRESVGSGFVIHPDGYIVTNAHVVAHTTEQKVTFADGREYDAQVIAADPGRDLAVLKIDAEGSLPTLPLGRSDDVMVGETVVAIGNPLGFQHTVTAGVVSAVDREITVSESLTFENLIQTDASINPGNSGGPLLNVEGELIGVNSEIRGDAQNIGFAIAVDQLRAVLPELIDGERRSGVLTGLRLDPVAMPRVRDVGPGTPAADAGIAPGDLLRAIDGRPVREGIDFDIALLARQPDDRLRLTFERDGRPFEAVLRLAPRPLPDGTALASEKLGVAVIPLPEDIADELGVRRGRGLVVRSVEPRGPAAVAGVRRYDVLISLGRFHLTTIDDLGRVLDTLDPGDAVELRVLRIDRGRKSQRSGLLRIR